MDHHKEPVGPSHVEDAPASKLDEDFLRVSRESSVDKDNLLSAFLYTTICSNAHRLAHVTLELAYLAEGLYCHPRADYQFQCPVYMDFKTFESHPMLHFSIVSSALINPGLVSISEALGVTIQQCSYCTTVYVLFSGVWPLFYVPLANSHGRRLMHVVRLTRGNAAPMFGSD